MQLVVCLTILLLAIAVGECFCFRSTKNVKLVRGYAMSNSLAIKGSQIGIDTNTRNSSVVHRLLRNSLIPSGKLSEDYFVYSKWRAIQRFISASNSVFGTQSLMIALGITKQKVGTTVASTWILKDFLGKISRIFWAGWFGKSFDANAKRWRFRSSFLYTLGNCLELITYFFPSWFLVTAALANALKQISILTSSATRNTM